MERKTRSKQRRRVDSVKALSQVSSCFINQDIVLFLHHFLPSPILYYWSCRQKHTLLHSKGYKVSFIKEILNKLIGNLWEEFSIPGKRQSASELEGLEQKDGFCGDTNSFFNINSAFSLFAVTFPLFVWSISDAFVSGQHWTRQSYEQWICEENALRHVWQMTTILLMLYVVTLP